jgi:branched-chain amino acid transport system substrate-binding protein
MYQKMKRFASGLAIAASFVLGLTEPAAAQNTIKVGVLGTYSGPSGTAGQMSDNIVKLFQQKYGTMIAGKNIEFVKRDTTGPNPEVAKRMAQELIVREKIQILIGPDFTANALAVAPLITEAKVPAILIGAATSGIVGERSPYYLRTFFATPQVARTMAQWAHRNGIKKPYTLVADFSTGHETEELFTKAFTDLGGTVAGSVRVPLRSPEFSSYVQRIKDARPDALFVFLPLGDMVPQFLKTYADSGLKSSGIKLIGTSDLTDESVIDAAGDAALGAITTGFYSSAHASAMNHQFVSGYVAQFGKTPRMAAPSVALWDAMRLVYDGIAAQGKGPFNGDKFMAFVKGRSFESPRGPIEIDSVNGDIKQNIYVRRVEKIDGVLQNAEFETIPAVSAKR